MKRSSLGFKIGIGVALFHFCMVLLACLAVWQSRSSTAGLAFIWFFFLDAPLFFLEPLSFGLFGQLGPLIHYGLLGSALWFLIPWLIGKIAARIFPRRPRVATVVCLIVAIPILLVGFLKLYSFSMERSIEGERPEELKGRLNSISSDFLTSKVVFSEDGVFCGISGISKMTCRPGAGAELLVALPRAVVFLDDNYQEKHRVSFGDRVFHTIEPADIDGKHSCAFLAYSFMEGAYLFDFQGKELWNYTQHDSATGYVEAARCGDIDGDGKQEVAVLDGYSREIRLLDSDGRTRWKHPAISIRHMEMADVRGNGKAEVVYGNFDCTIMGVDLTVLNATGAVASETKIVTPTEEFALVRWPRRKTAPNVLLTEDNKIRIVDLDGKAVIQLDAPGCRPFGDMRAVTVKLKKDEPEFLAVKKNLHPDLSVLYVYNAEGKLVYQKTDVTGGALAVTLAAVPAKEAGLEKLLVGAAQEPNVQVLELSAP